MKEHRYSGVLPKGEVKPSWSWVKKSSVAFLIVATLLYTIAFAAPYWGRTDLNKVTRDHNKVTRDEYIGMWRYCVSGYGGGQSCNDFIDLGSYGDWLKACQSFSTLAFVGILGTVGIFGVYVFASMENLLMLACALASSLLVVMFQVISVAVFATHYQEYFITKDDVYTADSCKLGWAWYVALVATIFTFVAPVILITDYVRNLTEDDD